MDTIGAALRLSYCKGNTECLLRTASYYIWTAELLACLLHSSQVKKVAFYKILRELKVRFSWIAEWLCLCFCPASRQPLATVRSNQQQQGCDSRQNEGWSCLSHSPGGVAQVSVATGVAIAPNQRLDTVGRAAPVDVERGGIRYLHLRFLQEEEDSTI